MGRDDDLRIAQHRGRGKVGNVAGQPAAVQRIKHGGLINQGTPRIIDQDGALGQQF